MKKIFKIATAFVIFILINAIASAADIEKGTFSIGGSTNAFFNQEAPKSGTKSEALILTLEAGYFFSQNWEIGMDIDMRLLNPFDDVRHDYYFRPYAGYNWSLNDTSSIYTRLGAGKGFGDNGWSSSGSDYNRRTTLVFGEVGYEYLITKNIALDLGLLAERRWIERDWDHQSDDLWDETEHETTNIVTTQLKLKIYF